MTKLLLAFVGLFLVACSDFQYNAVAINGSTETVRYRTLGGSSALDTAGGTRLTQNHNKSFGQGAQAVVAIAGGISASANLKSNNALEAAKDANAAKTAQQAAQLKAQQAAAETAAKATTTSKAIEVGTPVTPITVNPP